MDCFQFARHSTATQKLDPTQYFKASFAESDDQAFDHIRLSPDR
jgi:hypothetical protein